LAVFEPPATTRRESENAAIDGIAGGVRKRLAGSRNQPQTDKEMAELKSAVQRGRPFGSESWQAKTALSLGLGHTFRKRGRRRKTIQ